MAPLVFELPVFSAEAARTAIAHGASRLELNRAGSYPDGGLTPTRAEVEAVLAAVGPASSVPVRVMIRPRGPPADGSPDFLYTDEECQAMRAAIHDLAGAGLLQAARGDGFVFGLLREDRHVDVDRCRPLVAAAGPYACVFHRAFDAAVAAAAAADGPATALEAVAACGFAAILTAGGTGSQGAPDHPATLKKLVEAAAAAGGSGGGCEIIVGGGVRSRNLEALAQDIVAASSLSGTAPPRVAFHSSCLTSERAVEAVDGPEVERMVAMLKSVECRGARHWKNKGTEAR